LKLFLALIASHICGDVFLNAPFLAKAKRSDILPARLQVIGLHCLVHAGLVWLWLWSFERTLIIWASTYIFIVHFLIDLARTQLEISMIGRADLRVVKRKDFILYLMRRGNSETNTFMDKHARTWGLINIGDQFLHFLSFALFVVIT
jgi:hypothetical protein